MKMNPWFRWVRWRNRDSEIEAEIESHLAMLKHDLVERGESLEEAELHARREFGNRALITEVTRETWGWARLERFGRDLRFGLRSLMKRPGFAVASILIVALGVGANTAVFSVVNELLIRPLPYADAERLVDMSTLYRPTGEILRVSAPDFRDYRYQSTAFAALSLYSGFSAPMKVGKAAEFVETATVSRQFFSVFQLRALHGRLFMDEDFASESSVKPAVISESYWRSRYGADPHILGRTLRMSSSAVTVVGIAPGSFRFPEKTEIWMPVSGHIYRMSHSARNHRVVGRLKPGFSMEAAQSQLNGISARLERQYPRDNRGTGARIMPLRDQLVAKVRQSLLMLFCAVGTILLIAWVNLAGILLVRTMARTREMATRLAIGASRGHLWSQLLAESVVLSVPIAVFSMLLAFVGRRALVALASKEIGRLGGFALDGPVLAFTACLSVLTVLLFTCVPAWHACRLKTHASMKQSDGRAVGSAGARHLRALLVVGEIALSVILLAAAGLLVKSFHRLQSVDLGFNPQNVLVMTASYPTSRGMKPLEATQFFSRLRTEVKSIPGVTAAGAMRSLPAEETWSSGGYVVNHPPKPGTTTPEMRRRTAYVEVTPGTFQALGMPLIRGREFAEADVYEGPLVAIVNQALVRYSFPNQDPIGRTIFCGMDPRSMQGMRIVGVVGDIHQFGPAGPALPAIYMPNTQHPYLSSKMNIVVRSTLDQAALVQSMRRKALELSPDVPVKFTTIETLLKENTATPRFSAYLLGLLAALALCLAMVGIYGTLAYLVAQRYGEIGIRRALGAGIGSVFGLVMREGVRWIAFGLALGLLGAVAVTRMLASLLFEVKPNDPLVYAGMSLLLVLSMLAAVSVPAWRATRVDPLVALRLE